MKKTKMEKGRMILWGIAIIVVVLLVLATLGFRIMRSGAGSAATGGSSSDDNYASLPEKCRPPAGQDIAAWKEHLGHHAETQECLQYFS
ncbi:MAG TPA: hypothetical protein VJA86_03475 [Candidatus Nanoarchaeia archaeon]|nr:hypothetical protein [Candidatus Nanoarchaeia archaeon]